MTGMMPMDPSSPPPVTTGPLPSPTAPLPPPTSTPPVEEPPIVPPVEPPPIEPEPSPEPGLPGGDHCAPAADWDPLLTQFEDEVLLLVNERRAQGANCGSEGSYGPAAPLVVNAALRCAARLHSLDMATNGYFSHTNQQGEGPGQRMQDAGYSGWMAGENIAQGQPSPQDVVQGWMESDGHCANIMEGGYDEIGVGVYGMETQTPWGTRLVYTWTQNFGGTPN